MTLLIGGINIHMWKNLEDKIQEYNPQDVLEAKVANVQDITFIKNWFLGIGKDSTILGWLAHCKSNPKLNFHKYMEGLVGWARKEKRKNARKGTDGSTLSGHTYRESSFASLKMSNAGTKDFDIEDVESRSVHPVSMQSPVSKTRLLVGSK